MADFFVSYTSADKAWAEWIGFVLEEEGFTVVIQAWDFRPGSNFVLEMQRAATEADRTIMVLSPDYLKSQFASPEWAAAFAEDPQGLKRKLVPIVVRQCQALGLLSSIVHISLVDKEESAARGLLLNGLNAKRAKPTQRPSFPGSAVGRPHKPFPGPASSGGTGPAPYIPNLKRSPTDADRRRFNRQAFEVIKVHFQTALEQLAQHSDAVECDFQPNTATEFMAEVPVIDFARLGYQRRNLRPRPEVNASRLKRNQDSVGNREGGAKAPRVASANVNHNLGVLIAELPHLLPDRRALKLDRGKLRFL